MTPFAVIFAAGVALIVALVLSHLEGNFWTAAKTAGWAVTGSGLYVSAVAVVSLLIPQTVVNVGDSYCFDIWCIGIDHVTTQIHNSETLTKVDLHIFSDANHVKVRANGRSPYVMDERGRRFPPVPGSCGGSFRYNPPSRRARPLKTTLMFATTPDSKPLFLTWDEKVSLIVKAFYAGPFPKQTLFRVL